MVRIVTDSTANLKPELAAQHNILVIPLKVQMGNQAYSEGVDLTGEEYIRKLPSQNPLPTTSQPTPIEFEEAYNRILAEGDEIISIHLSSDLSGTHNSATIGANSTDKSKITVIDSRTISVGLTMLAIAAAEMAKAGKSRSEIVASIEKLMQTVPLALTLDTLEYLRKGGRIGGAQALIGGLLKIKPTIEVKNGKLEAGERARSRGKALDLLVEKMVATFGNKPIWVGIAEVASPDVAEFEKALRAKLNVQRLYICTIGPVVATHTGPNTIGVAGMHAPTL
jgi:DegV family protein with EDD domain